MTNQRIGYGRISTSDQNASSQEDALKAADDELGVLVSGFTAVP